MAKINLTKPSLYPEKPKAEKNWKVPVGHDVRMSIYKQDEGWMWKKYTVVKYFPHIVHCKDANGFSRCFGYWEFKVRQKKRPDAIKGGGSHFGIEERLSG